MGRIRRLLGRLKRQVVRPFRSAWQQWVLNQVETPTPRQPGTLPRVSYAHAGFPKPLPGPDTLVSGGAVKYRYLNQWFPYAGLKFDILYVVSSSHCNYLDCLIQVAKSRGAKVVWNQNGAYFPSAYGSERARQGNAAMAPLLHRADYVFYQSEFARYASDYFLGKRQRASEVLYNAIDTKFFSPGDTRRSDGLILLVAGSHNDTYRLPIAVNTLALVAQQCSGVRLLIAGRIPTSVMVEIRNLVSRLGLESQVEVLGPYTQQAAPEVFRQAHILLHTQYNDVCPPVVAEAMACGLPVVYSHSGGTPELVGQDAGYGVPSALNWEEAQPPDPQCLAEGVLCIAEDWPRYSEAARERAVSNFDLGPWLERHRQVFEMLMEMER